MTLSNLIRDVAERLAHMLEVGDKCDSNCFTCKYFEDCLNDWRWEHADD